MPFKTYREPPRADLHAVWCGGEKNLPLPDSAMLGKSQQATVPLLWIPGCMEDAVDCHLPTGVLVKDGVRKTIFVPTI